jgi:hypothetical protein
VSLTPFQRRRAWAVLALAAVLVVICLVAGSVVAAVVIVVLTPAAVYRVTGHSWQQAFSWAFGREPVPRATRGPRRRSEPERPPRRVASVGLLVAGVPAVLGLLSALAGKLVDSDDAVLAVGMLMTLTWTGFAALLSGLVVASQRDRTLIALGAGAATIVSVLIWAALI